MPEIQVESTGKQICHRCSGTLALTVRIPHSFTRADGHMVTGAHAVGLCVRCDRDDEAAQGVLAFFAVHEKITESTVHDLGPVLMEWITYLTTHSPASTGTDLDEEIRQWRAENSDNGGG